MGHDISKRSVVVTSKATGASSIAIAEIVGLSKRTVDRIWERDIEKGFNPDLSSWNISDNMLADAPRSGRPKKQSLELKDRVLSKVRLDQYGREKCVLISLEKLVLGSRKQSLPESLVQLRLCVKLG